MLTLENVQAGYGEITALWDVTLQIAQGEMIAVVGPNGAGKSTLINTISGLVDQTGGKLLYEGQSLKDVPAEQRVTRGIIQCPEGRKLFPEMTVEENLMIGAFTRTDRDRLRESLDEMFSLFPILRERRKQIAQTLSGGQQQMVAIARALMAKPRLLMLDEPSLGLAPIVVDEVFALLRRIHEQGMTILLIEQNVQQTLEVADRAYVLENGKISMQGPANELLRNEHMRAAYLGV